MIASAHIAAGALVAMASARVTKNSVLRIILAFAIGVLSHVLLDAIPHSDYRPFVPRTVRWIALGEVFVTTTIAWLIMRRRLSKPWMGYVLAGILGAVLPDAKFFGRFFGSALPRWMESVGNQFHVGFHASDPASVPLAWAVEIACALIFLGALTRFPESN